MPFTPLHMGPGLLIKSILRGSFSLMLFGWAQILMDIQPLLVMVTGKGHLHGFSHTLVGACLIGTFAALSGKPIIEYALKSPLLHLSAKERRFLGVDAVLRWPVVVLSAAIGTFSHVYLDAIMHGDLQPLYPFDLQNPLLGMISLEMLHRVCVYSGLLGAAIFLLAQWVGIRRGLDH